MEIAAELSAYTAGLLDGDGWIYWQTEARPRHGNGYPSVGISQTDVNNGGELLRQLQNEWGDIGVVTSQDRVTNLGVQSLCYWWTIRRRSDAEMFLDHLRPYLRVKAAAAEDVLERLRDHKWSQWTEDEDAVLVALYGSVSLREIGLRLGRGSSQAVGFRAAKLGLRPTAQKQASRLA